MHGEARRQAASSCPRVRHPTAKGAFLAGSSPASNVTSQRHPASGDEPSQPLRVLIVDDDRDTLLTLGLLLREAGMYVHLLRLGAHVMEAMASFRPQVVVLDLVLPDRSGLEVAEEIVLHYGEERPILIAITGYSSETDRRLAKAAGFEDFIAKPYDPQALLRRLAALRTSG
jgi:DNA-binding response OmpR family regulator